MKLVAFKEEYHQTPLKVRSKRIKLPSKCKNVKIFTNTKLLNHSTTVPKETGIVMQTQKLNLFHEDNSFLCRFDPRRSI